MNSIKIFQLDQCEIIINDLVYLSGKQSEEIYHNRWGIDSNWDDEGDEQEYVLDVFVKKLNTKIYG